MIIDELKIMK